MSAPGTPKASEDAVAAVQDALGPCKQSGTSPNGFDTPVCLTHCEYWTERGCPVAVAAADAAAPHIAAQTLRDAADEWEALVQVEKPPVRGSLWLHHRADRIEAGQ